MKQATGQCCVMKSEMCKSWEVDLSLVNDWLTIDGLDGRSNRLIGPEIGIGHHESNNQ